MLLQTDRTRKAAALKIQSYYRGHIIRQKHKNRLRAEFDLIQNAYKQSSTTPKNNTNESIETKEKLTTHLLAFFDVDQDSARIVRLFYIILVLFGLSLILHGLGLVHKHA